MRHGKVRVIVMLTACFLLILSNVYALWANLLWPEATGETVLQDGILVVDASHAADGYFMVRADEGGSERYKLRVQLGKKKVPEYDLTSNGEWTIIPFQLGNGKYTITLFKRGSKGYTTGGKLTVKVEMPDENAPFLVPNQYVNYNPDTEAVALSEELCAEKNSDAEKLEAIRVYIHDNYLYDYDRAESVTTGLLPDIDYCTTNKMGICQDLAAMAVCMLRVQGVPARLMIGWTGKIYHAWVTAIVDGEEVRYDPANDINDVTPKSYTLERYY
ncbi:MAG: transglutaminase-like domain-containing protein [Clostridiales bacterium]|nr:transglutaminase-like domain-containing protein [Clostridiales bacterium]